MVLELACNQNILSWRQFINHDMYIIVAILAFFSHFSIRLCGKKLKFWKEITRLCNRNNYFTNIQWVEIFCLQLAGPPKVRETWFRGNGILFPKYCHYCEKKKCSLIVEKLWKFDGADREFAEILRLLEQLIRRVKGQYYVWNRMLFWRFLRSDTLEQL